MTPTRGRSPSEMDARRLERGAQDVLWVVRREGRAIVRAPDEVAVARVLRKLGATDSEMKRITFSHEPGDE